MGQGHGTFSVSCLYGEACVMSGAIKNQRGSSQSWINSWNGKMDILFFSRGRGRGHAIPDIAIMQEVVSRRPDISWSFASYGTGAETFKFHDYQALNLELPDENLFFPTLIRASELI